MATVFAADVHSGLVQVLGPAVDASSDAQAISHCQADAAHRLAYCCVLQAAMQLIT
jgi:hypothetical protein